MAEAQSSELTTMHLGTKDCGEPVEINVRENEELVLGMSAEYEPTRTPTRRPQGVNRGYLGIFRRLRERMRPRRLVSIQVFVVCMCVMASLSSALSTGYVNSVISTIEKRFEIGSFLAGTIAASYEFGCIALLLVTYYGGRRHIPYWIGTGAIIMACGSFLFTVPHLITDSYTLRFTTDANRSVPNLCMAPGGLQPRYSDAQHEAHEATKRINMYVQSECDITETQSKNEARYVFVLIIAQMLIGWGGAPNLALGTAYIDAHCLADGTRARAPIYIACIYAASSLGTVLGFAVGALMLRFRVDYHLPSDYATLEREIPSLAALSNATVAQSYGSLHALWTTMQSTDPRWIGAWWAGFLLFGTLLLLASGCFFLFPKRIDDTEVEKKRKEQSVTLALSTVESRLDQLATLDSRDDAPLTIAPVASDTPDADAQVNPDETSDDQEIRDDRESSRVLMWRTTTRGQTNEIEEASDSESEEEPGGFDTLNVIRSETPMSNSVSASASAASSQSQGVTTVTAAETGTEAPLRPLDSMQYGREIRELPRAIAQLFRNPVFVVTALGICFIVSIVSGFVVFLPKHLEQQFALTKSSANLLTGTIAVPGASLGILLGGVLVRRLQLTCLDAVKLSIVLHFATLLCYLLTFALGCNNLQLAGITVRYDFTFDTGSNRFADSESHAVNDSASQRFASRSRTGAALKFGTQIRDEDYISVYSAQYESSSANLSARCNSACRCASQRVEYVCVEELGVTFFSPCYAGCRTEVLVLDGRVAAQLSVDSATPQALAQFESVREAAARDGVATQRFYVDCQCLDESLLRSLRQKDQNNTYSWSSSRRTSDSYPFTVTPGICDKKCRMLAPFLVVLFTMTLLVTATQMPLLNVVLRSVAECERSFALGIMFIFVRLAAYLPSPIVFGSVIDTTCLLRRDELELPVQAPCESGGTVLNNKLNRYADKRSSCELYDVVKFRLRYTGLLTIYEFASLFCFIVVLFILRRRRRCSTNVAADANSAALRIKQSKARRARQHPLTRFLVRCLGFPRRARHVNANTEPAVSSSTDVLGASSL